MMNIIKLEIKKSMNIYFFISIAIGIVLVCMSSYTIMNTNKETLELFTQNNPIVSSMTVFNSWIGGECYSLGNSIFFFVFPLIIAIPYGWSYCSEKNTGYLRMMLVKVGRRKYYFAKFIAIFISGGLAMTIPMIISFYLAHLYVPIIKPVVEFDIYYGVNVYSLMASLYYQHPYIYTFLYILIDFVFAGLLACISMATATFIKQKWINIIVPFLLCIVISFSTKFIYREEKMYYELSPFNFLRCCGGGYPASFSVIIPMALIICIFIVGIFVFVEKKKDVI